MIYQSSRKLFSDLVAEITAVYPENEAKSMAYLLLEYWGKLSKTDILMDKSVEIREPLAPAVARIKAFEPIQYIIGYGDFYGRSFQVSSATLIPRPETEELVQYIIQKAKAPVRILDIGTGTGCIAISLACEIQGATVVAYDISEEALAIAQNNNITHQAKVQFQYQDILATQEQTLSQKFDIIVSNPPYVTNHEKSEMEANVLDYEPHLALFVENDNPLLFYKAIAQFASLNLVENGLCMVEINQYFGKETAEVFVKAGFQDVEIIQDMLGRDRFVKGILQK